MYRDTVAIDGLPTTGTAKAYAEARIAALGVSTDGITVTRVAKAAHGRRWVEVSFRAETNAQRIAFLDGVLNADRAAK